MNLKHSATSMTLVLLAVSVISITSIQQDAFASARGMAVSAVAPYGSDTINITGYTTSHVTDVTIRVTSPNGNNVTFIDQVKPDSKGNFVSEIKTSSMWKENGLYTIKIMQGVQANPIHAVTLRIEVNDGKTLETSIIESNLPQEFTPKPVLNKGLVIREANSLAGSNVINIFGKTDITNEDITIKVISPNGNVVVIEQITPELSGEFTKDIITGGPLWKKDGNYKITAQQGTDPKYKNTIEVGIKDGVVIPEFGAIAAMILAVAIISIIVVSAKSRLIMPRY